MSRVCCILGFCFLIHTGLWAQSLADWSGLKNEFERVYAEASYADALGTLERMGEAKDLPEAEADWLAFRMADCRWRIELAKGQDTLLVQEQKLILTDLADRLKPADGSRPPRLWVEVMTSLAELTWQESRNAYASQAYTTQILDYWAGSTDLDEARNAYLKVVDWMLKWQRSGVAELNEILLNAIRLEEDPVRKAYYYYELARISQGANIPVSQTRSYFQQALRNAQDANWRPDLLLNYAQWEEQSGASYYDEAGAYRRKGNFVNALELYRSLIREYAKGESPYQTEAEAAIRRISDPQLRVMVSNQFQPGIIPKFAIAARNLPEIRLTVHQVKLNELLKKESLESTFMPGNVEEALLGNLVYDSTISATETEPYEELRQEVSLPKALPAGLYLIEASRGEVTARDMLLVTDTSLQYHASGYGNYLFWMVSAAEGVPVAGGRLTVWNVVSGKGDMKPQGAVQLQTGEDGLVSWKAGGTNIRQRLILGMSPEGAPAFISNMPDFRRSSRTWTDWSLYVFADRPAYRPEDTVHWKVIARSRDENAMLELPEENLSWEIVGPRGTVINQGVAEWNEYGSFSSELSLKPEFELGIYSIRWKNNKNRVMHMTELFRLEEYRLPEFKVSVSTRRFGSEEEATAFRLGDTLEVTVQADYYFGAPVSDAEVVFAVYQSPYYPGWWPQPRYTWMPRVRPPMPQSRQIVERVVLKTDSQGRATYQLETGQRGGQNWEYHFEARVVDSSRREVTGQGMARVTLQPYFAFVHPVQSLYQPGETVRVNIKTLNANDKPVSAEGRIIVTRDRWREVWVGPAGERLSGEEYREREKQPKRGLFSRSVDLSGYRLEYETKTSEEVESVSLKTNEKGEAVYELKLEKEGLYQFKWVGRIPDGPPVTAATSVWVSSEQSDERAFRGPLKIVADEDSFKIGHQAPVLVTAPASGRYVLASVLADGLLEYKVVRIEGTAKMVPFTVTRAWVPNVQLQAFLVDDYRLHYDSMEINVLPEDAFLDVEVETGAEVFLPGQEVEVHLQARDRAGRTVEAELALSVVDEAVYAIQPELAPGIEAYFYGVRRQFYFNYGSSLQNPSFVRESREDMVADYAAVRKRSQAQPQRGYLLGEVDYFSASGPPAPRMMASANAVADARVESAGEVPEMEVTVRTDFRNTAYWNPFVVTDKQGKAVVKTVLPESLTSWRLTARGITRSSEVGQAEETIRTQLPLIARLQTTRFLITGDNAVFTGVFNNNTDSDMRVRARLEVEGLELSDAEVRDREIKVPAQGEARLDWSVAARLPGEAKLVLKAASGQNSDGMERSIPVIEHGMVKQLAASGRMVNAEESIDMILPPHKEEGLSFEVVATPSLAVTMLDALPYLAEFPYGCTEQTISRFVPAVVIKRTLRELGVDADILLEQRFGGISGEAGKTSRLAELDAMTEKGLKRLYDFQRPDGAWGWWKEGPANLYMSAYVLWGLTLAENAGIEVEQDVLRKAREYLTDCLVDVEAQYDMQSWILFTLASRFMEVPGQPGRFEARAFANLWRNRDLLNNYSRALLTLSAHYFGFEEEALILVDNLRNGVILNENPQSSVLVPSPATNATGLPTAYWGRSGFFWRWSESGVEATAFAVSALVAVDPSNDLLQPAVNWLLKNRRGANWSSTKDTAITILALNDFLKQSKELEAEGTFEILLNGTLVATETLKQDGWLRAPSRFQVDARLLREGSNTVTLKRVDGSFGLYYSVLARFFTLEKPIQAAGSEVFAGREFFRLVPVPTLLKGYELRKEPLNDGDEVRSGDRIEVVLTLDAKNDYEFMMIEDWKAAGLEAVELQSGLPLSAREIRPEREGDQRYTGRTRWVYQELRDQKVACFINRLPQGVWEIRYELRAESPGHFSALPTVIQAMYIPEIQGNSQEADLVVQDKEGIQD